MHKETAIYLIITGFFKCWASPYTHTKILFVICNPILPLGQLENGAVYKQELILDYNHSVSKEKAYKKETNAC